jgi:hypothetical protein
MALTGGGDREWIRAVDPDQSERRGTHRGKFEALNVSNPRAGFIYYYERRKPSDVLRRMNEGWEVVKGTDQEDWGAELPDDIGQELDGVKAYGDVILMRIPEDRYRKIEEQRKLLRMASRGGNTDEYLEKGNRVTSQSGIGRPAYYQRSDHETVYDDQEE